MGRSSSPGSTFYILPAAYGLGAGIATGTIPDTLSFTPLIVIKQEQQDKYSNKRAKTESCLGHWGVRAFRRVEASSCRRGIRLQILPAAVCKYGHTSSSFAVVSSILTTRS